MTAPAHGEHGERDALSSLAYWVAVGFGLGKLPVMPGTWGSLGAIFPGLALLHWAGPAGLVAGILAATAAGIWAAGRHQAATGFHDMGEVVIDEIAGQWITLLPLAFLSPTGALWSDATCAFIAFRVFDIIKPWPIGLLDRRVKGGTGVMIDDVAAGIYGGIVLVAAGVLI